MNPDGINPDVVRQLMITVERVVRPVKTWDNRKTAIRKELLNHLSEIYLQEWDRSGEESTALAAARLRFGVPEQLARDLQRGVPRIPGWADWLNNVFRVDVKVSAQRNALRWTMFWFCELFFLFALCDLVVILKGISPWPMIATLMIPLVMMVLIAYVALEGAFAAALNGDDRRSYWRITRHACYKLGVLGFVYKIMLSSQMIPLWEQFDSREASMVVLSMLMLPAVFLLVMWGGRNEFRQQVEWARLDLSEELPV